LTADHILYDKKGGWFFIDFGLFYAAKMKNAFRKSVITSGPEPNNLARLVELFTPLIRRKELKKELADLAPGWIQTLSGTHKRERQYLQSI